jgi:hypothetical protein
MSSAPASPDILDTSPALAVVLHDLPGVSPDVPGGTHGMDG